MCNGNDLEILLTWEIGRKAKGRRQFYYMLKRKISQIPDGCCVKVGGSVYLVKRKHAHKFEEFLSKFEGPRFSWHKFEIKK